MDLLSDDVTHAVTDPLDAVEQAVIAEQYAYEREDEGELHMTVPGAWRDHQIWFAWRPELDALHICASLDLKAPAGRTAPVCELITRLNEKLWVGHFDLWADEGAIVYRHAMCLPGGETVSPAQAAAMIAAAKEAGERFYPAFHFLVWGGKTVEESVAAAMFETAGEA
ncbi:YbjN domain-containing protein [Maricaulis sp. D1M11]|uniref:YbjN domain-containing protein n=1 Tax=Maricaulis sp. D1M11 TaxID=3076117 RepID=UPI0039B50766